MIGMYWQHGRPNDRNLPFRDSHHQFSLTGDDFSHDKNIRKTNDFVVYFVVSLQKITTKYRLFQCAAGIPHSISTYIMWVKQ